jgi:hypothetical protein
MKRKPPRDTTRRIDCGFVVGNVTVETTFRTGTATNPRESDTASRDSAGTPSRSTKPGRIRKRERGRMFLLTGMVALAAACSSAYERGSAPKAPTAAYQETGFRPDSSFTSRYRNSCES